MFLLFSEELEEFPWLFATVALPCRSALWSLVSDIPPDVLGRVKAIAIDGTSATTLLIDERDGSHLATPKLYNEAQVCS